MRLKLFFLLLSIVSLLVGCQKQHAMPTVSITTQDVLTFESKKQCEFEFQDGKNNRVVAAKIKYRGGFSHQFEKHSYTINLVKPLPLLGLSAANDWILNANYIDKTFMRHKISYDLFTQMNDANQAAKSRYVQLIFNNKPQGIYVLMQQINEQTIALNLHDELAVLFKEPLIFYQERLDSAKAVPNYYDQKYPDFKVNDQSAYLEKMKHFLFESSDEVFADSIDYWFDVSNVIDWHILLLLTNNGDGIMKNFFLYKLDSTTPFRIAPWDYDHSFCRDGDNEYNDLESELNWRRSILLKRLVEVSETHYLPQLKARWKELRYSKLISEAYLYQMMEDNRVLLEYAINKNFEIWPVESKWYFDSNTFQQEYDLMKACIAKRIPQMDEYIANL